MSAPLAILSDIHGNSVSLDAVLADVTRQGCRRIIFLGDLINGPDPAGCVARLRGLAERGIQLSCIQGNAEAYTITPGLDQMPGREEPENAETIALVRWYRARLSPAGLAWLAAWPTVLIENAASPAGAAACAYAHDSPLDRLFPERWRRPGLADGYQEWYYYAPGIKADLSGEPLEELLRWMAASGVLRVFCGHTHEPFVRPVSDRLVCNAGSVGFCLDGDPRPSWLLVDHNNEVTLRRVEYDIEEAIRLIDQAGYPPYSSTQQAWAYKQMIRTARHWSTYLRSA